MRDDISKTIIETTMERKIDQPKPKIEVIRVSSIERGNFRPLDGVQLRAAYSHVRIGTYCPEAQVKQPILNKDGKPPIELGKFKKNLGPVSRLLKRRHHATCLATKSCDNIYSVNRHSNSLDWRLNPINTEQARQSSSLDWRVETSIASGSNRFYWADATRSAEQLSRTPLQSDHLRIPNTKTKSKIVSLLKRLSPRLSRPSSKGSIQSSPTLCPWVQVEYSSESIDCAKRQESQESDISFQRELQINELKKLIAGVASTSQVPAKVSREHRKQENLSQARIHIHAGGIVDVKNVHEDRGEAKGHRQQGGGGGKNVAPRYQGGGEVAGLGDVDDSRATTVTSLVPGASGGIRSNRRTRPHSLAVQSLNYQLIDPEHHNQRKQLNQTTSIVARHHPNMTSQESIGSCSLDVDRSASDRSENNTVDSISEKTLHSLQLSCNGESAQENLLPEKSQETSNGHRDSPEPEQLTVKKPSYLGLACSISGYSGITRYDSKLREGFRSRDSSPGPRFINRDPSPAGFRPNEISKSISPLAMDHHQNGYANGSKEECYVGSICQGYSEVDKGVDPRAYKTPVKRSPGMTKVLTCGQQNKSYSSFNSSDISLNDSSCLCNDTDNSISNRSSSSEKSFIQQRVERLYGPGALAQGFFFKRSPTSKPNTSDSNLNKSINNNNDTSTDNAKAEESLKNLPVMRHLRPEFRAQLPVVGSRKPTDGTEQIIKPLQRLTPVSRKYEQKIIPSPTKIENIPDQQLAAPEVVLPVLDTSQNSNNILKQVEETEKTKEEKDGHYFIKLLKEETDKLFSLANSVELELELANGDSNAVPEEAAGKLRSAAGKARLLATQKMQQFEGLCQKNINQVPGEAFPTTNEDLAGFWDMVMLQVVQVNELFNQIDKLRKSHWQESIPAKTTIPVVPQNGNTKRRIMNNHKTKSTPNTEANKKAREAREQARRQMLEERRRAMRSNTKNTDNSIKIFTPDT